MPPKRRRGPAAKNRTAFQIKVTLNSIEPEIWRRLVVPSNITLEKLHEAIQVAMGWTNSHLHQFSVGDAVYGNIEHFDDDVDVADERGIALAEAAPDKGSAILYRYDMGDNWEHAIVVEEIVPADGGEIAARCLDGARACPPEDVGGPGGYGGFLEAIKDPGHEEHEDLLEWAGGAFDPEEFSLHDVNAELRDLQKAGSLEALWPPEEE